MTPCMATLEPRQGHNTCYLHNKASYSCCLWQHITLHSHKSPSQRTSRAINPSTQPTRCLVLSCFDRQHVRLLVSRSLATSSAYTALLLASARCLAARGVWTCTRLMLHTMTPHQGSFSSPTTTLVPIDLSVGCMPHASCACNL
jgi:hypothetical protein